MQKRDPALSSLQAVKTIDQETFIKSFSLEIDIKKHEDNTDHRSHESDQNLIKIIIFWIELLIHRIYYEFKCHERYEIL